MPYKTILVHLNHAARAHALLDLGIVIAQRFEARLIGCHAFPANRLTPSLPLPFAAELASQIKGAITQETSQLQAVFEERTAHQPFTSEWRSITSERREAALTMIEQAHAADIVIASQPDPSWEYSEILDFPERLALGAGRPVLVVPNFGRYAEMPKNITVAWDGRREFARAVWDALPLLQCATQVYLITVMESARSDPGGLPDTEISAALARHGVKAIAANVSATEYTVGEEIRVRAVEQNADLLVMGCYGHSRLREYALGGATRHLLREMTIPILFSH